MSDRLPSARTVRGLLLAVACAVSAACKSLDSTDRQVLQAYLENAAQYYDAGRYENALQQWGKALALDPDEERALLGQAMALFQLSQGDSREGLTRLGEAERLLGELRDGRLGDQSWKAELGYALVQNRWAEMYELAARVHEAASAQGRPGPSAAEDRARMHERVRLAESSFHRVLADSRTEPNFKLTAWIGLARTCALRGAYAESLAWCREFEAQVVQSRRFWEKQGETYESKLFGATIQESELRDVMGNTLFKLGRFEEAEKELSQLVALQPKRASAYLNRGILREARGAWDLARSDFAMFLSQTNLPEDDLNVLEAEKRRLLCEQRLAAELERATAPR